MNWKYTIKIKKHFEIITTPELIIKLCTILVKRLDSILEDSQKTLQDDSADDIYYELEESKDNFEFLLHLADGTIKEEEWDDYGFEGNFEKWFNDYLEQLYDISDTVVILKNGEKNKLIWIE
jgi:hypothetical protein